MRESRLFLQLATLTSCSSLAASKVGAILIRLTHQERPFCANSASSLSSCSFLAAPRVGAMSVRFAHQQRPFCANSASSWQWKPPCLFPAVPECCRPSSRRVCVAWWQGLFSSLHYPPCNSLCHYATVAHLARPGSSSHRHGRGRGRAVRAQRTLQAGHARHTFSTAHRTALRWFPPCSWKCEWLPCCGGQGGYPLTLLPLCSPPCHHRVTKRSPLPHYHAAAPRYSWHKGCPCVACPLLRKEHNKHCHPLSSCRGVQGYASLLRTFAPPHPPTSHGRVYDNGILC